MGMAVGSFSEHEKEFQVNTWPNSFPFKTLKPGGTPQLMFEQMDTTDLAKATEPLRLHIDSEAGLRGTILGYLRFDKIARQGTAQLVAAQIKRAGATFERVPITIDGYPGALKDVMNARSVQSLNDTATARSRNYETEAFELTRTISSNWHSIGEGAKLCLTIKPEGTLDRLAFLELLRTAEAEGVTPEETSVFLVMQALSYSETAGCTIMQTHSSAPRRGDYQQYYYTLADTVPTGSAS
jgi:hypothetical protein